MGTIVAKLCMSCGAGLGADSLVCAFCGAAHVVTGGRMAVGCPGCGAGNTLEAKHCVQCRASLVVTCPECRASSPHGSRYCQDCRIEFRGYRRAAILRAACVVTPEQVETRVVDWLDGRWFKAWDLREQVRIIDKTLLWLPTWRLRSRVTGKVQGQVSQTHYRTTTTTHYDHESQKWIEKPDSEPYKVWNHVTKDFDRTLDVKLPASAEARPFYDALALAGGGDGKPVDEEPTAAHPWERVFDPDLTDVEAFAVLRRTAQKQLHGDLLEKVESVEERWLSPTLTIAFQPVWQVVYRYKKTHGDARIHGTTGAVTGKRVTLLDQWFS
jgi:hypothetical protein